MATRQVKRIKRTKKHLLRGRRKTCTRHNRGGMLKYLASNSSIFDNPKGGEKYNGIEVWTRGTGLERQYYIGNRPLQEYLESSVEDDRVYGTKIQNALNNIEYNVKPTFPFKGQIYLDTVNFHKFQDALRLPDIQKQIDEKFGVDSHHPDTDSYLN